MQNALSCHGPAVKCHELQMPPAAPWPLKWGAAHVHSDIVRPCEDSICDNISPGIIFGSRNHASFKILFPTTLLGNLPVSMVIKCRYTGFGSIVDGGLEG